MCLEHGTIRSRQPSVDTGYGRVQSTRPQSSSATRAYPRSDVLGSASAMINDLDLGAVCDGLDEKFTRQAYFLVTQHRIGHCNLGLNVVRVLCSQCTAKVLQANAFD